MIDDDDRHAHVGRQLLEQPDIGIKAASRTAHANNGKPRTGNTGAFRSEADQGRFIHGSLFAMGLGEESGLVALFRLILLLDEATLATVSWVAFWRTEASESPGEPTISCPPGA